MSNLRVAFAGLLIALGATGTAAPVPADRAKAEQMARAERLKAEKELAVVAGRVHGAWEQMCEGRLELRPNGTYAWTDIARRGGLSHSGYWSLRGNPAAPNLVLHCTVASAPKGGANPPDEQGKTTEWKFTFEEDGDLTLEAPNFIPFARAQPAK